MIFLNIETIDRLTEDRPPFPDYADKIKFRDKLGSTPGIIRRQETEAEGL